ncbi:MAG: hypothetical protein SGI77_22060 [Pirellulaceae bacterium]|nr:hypothetical protein [Pirellulaceae bacterium]
MDPSQQYPVRAISRLKLTILLLAISIIPPAFVVTMVVSHKPPPEPRLVVKVTQDLIVHAPRNSPTSPRILPCIIVENPTAETWRNIAVSLNKEFFYYHSSTLESSQSFTVPLEFFVTKGGNVAFQPGSETVRQVTVFAQIPSGARGVRELFFDRDGQAAVETENP